jgi:ABC-type branched-subunit amino acid transport system substrate-binding protein
LTRRAVLVAGCAASAAALALAGCSTPSAPGSPTPVHSLVIGTLVPKTGSLAHLGPAEAAGIALAVKQVNAAGGVLGQPVTTIDGDSGDAYTTIASQSVDRELAGKVTAVVGATGSSVTAEVIDKVVASGVVLVSPGDGSDTFTAYPSHGLYFRVVPPDVLQASVLAGLLKAAGHRNVAILHVRDLYGAGLAADLAADVTKSGGQVAVSVEYDGQAAEFAAQVAQVSAAAPDAVVLVGAGETHKLIAELTAAGVGPAAVPLYLSDLALSNVLAQGLPAASMRGVEGTRPGAAPTPAFLAALAAQAPDLTDVGYAAQSYDAVMMIALAADAAGSTTGKAIAGQLDQVGTGPARCASYAACLALVKSGRTIAYVGASGSLPLGADGTPTAGTIGVYRFGATGTYPSTGVSYVAATVPNSPQVAP